MDNSDKDNVSAENLVSEFEVEKSRTSRAKRKIFFVLGFSQCRYCIYCNSEGDEYREMRESALLAEGKCEWSGKSVSSNLSYSDLRKYHRCPAFTAVLYNFKNYSINPNEIKNIYSRRKDIFFTWAGWIIALLAIYND